MPPQNSSLQTAATNSTAATKTMEKSKEIKAETDEAAPEENHKIPANPEDIDLIDVMNNLQNKLIASGHSLDVNLPQIAVVGAQSAGKSSVLENIVGREFLPRGKGVVTRRPILIQLFPTRGEEYGSFGHKPDVRFTDFNAIKKEIQDQMPTSTHPDQNSKCFSSVPIQLKIYSPRVLKLTLVDLPGLVRVAVDGHSPDTVTEVREMVLKYISQPECIILAVSPANQDLATSDALEIAKVADPARERTIGVITKIDRMEACTDARKVLENREIQLRRGYIGVINRSQQDIEEGRDIDYILEKEKTFFSEEPAYKDMAHKMGTPYLRRMLQKTLRLHIKGALPDTRAAIAEKLSKLDRHLEELNAKIGGDGKGGQFYMLRLVTDFIQDIYTELMGNSEMIKLGQISSGALINYKLNTEVLSYLRLSLVPKAEDLTALITSLGGIRTTLSFPSLALDAINRKMVAEYEYPLQRSVDCIRKVLEDAVVKSAELMNGYPSMQNEVIYRIREQIKEEATKTYSRLKDHVHAEMFYVNLEHPDLDLSICETVVPTVGPTKVWEVQPQESVSSSVDFAASNDEQLMNILMLNEPTQKKVQYIMLVMTKYLEIVQKQMVDVAIKYIVSFLIKKVLDFVKKDLIPTLLSSPNFGSFTEDCEEDFRLKGDMEKTAACLREALDAIQSF